MDECCNNSAPHTHQENTSDLKNYKEELRENSEEKNTVSEDIQLINFTVKVKDDIVCFSCGEKVVTSIPCKNHSVFESILSFDKNVAEDFLKTNQNCTNCETKLFYIYKIPVAIANNILEEDIKVKIAPQFIKQIDQKLIELSNIYKLIAIHEQPENAVSLIHDYPHYFFFKLISDKGDSFLNLNGYKKHLVNEKTISSVKEIASKLYEHMYSSKQGKISMSTRPYLQSLGTSFYGIDEDYLTYQSMLFLDIDGTISKKTLENCSGNLSTTLFRLLSALEKNKFLKVVLNTGRPTIWGMLYMKDLGLSPLVIGNNGTGICYMKKTLDNTNSNLILSNAPTTTSLSYLLDVLSYKYGLKFGVLTKSNSSCGEVIVSNLGIPEPKYLEKLINQDSEIRLFLEEVGLGYITCTDDGGGYINIRSSKYNKAKTALNLICALNYPIDNCFNIGNAENDVCLIEILKENSYGVANSDPVYKEKVFNLSPHKEAKGVVDIIKKFLISKKICSQSQYDTLIESVKEEVKKQNDFLFQ